MSDERHSRQLVLLDAQLAPAHGSADRQSIPRPPAPRSRRAAPGYWNRMSVRADQATPPPHHAPRGDLFRELCEQDRAASIAAHPDRKQRAREQFRAETYGRLFDSGVFHGRKKLKGSIDCLRRKIGSNRCAEFDSWLTRIGVKGGSLTVRYSALLSLVSSEIDEIAMDFAYTADMYRSMFDPAKDARSRLDRAQSDVGELQPLLSEMRSLYYHLHSAKRHAALPPAPAAQLTQEEMRASCAKAAAAERATRVEQSRAYLRELAQSTKHAEGDVRAGGRWITLDATLAMIRDDLTGYNNLRPLWPAMPAVDQLAQDYRISKRDARRVLAAAAAGVDT